MPALTAKLEQGRAGWGRGRAGAGAGAAPGPGRDHRPWFGRREPSGCFRPSFSSFQYRLLFPSPAVLPVLFPEEIILQSPQVTGSWSCAQDARDDGPPAHQVRLRDPCLRLPDSPGLGENEMRTLAGESPRAGAASCASRRGARRRRVSVRRLRECPGCSGFLSCSPVAASGHTAPALCQAWSEAPRGFTQRAEVVLFELQHGCLSCV